MSDDYLHIVFEDNKWYLIGRGKKRRVRSYAHGKKVAAKILNREMQRYLAYTKARNLVKELMENETHNAFFRRGRNRKSENIHR